MKVGGDAHNICECSEVRKKRNKEAGSPARGPETLEFGVCGSHVLYISLLATNCCICMVITLMRVINIIQTLTGLLGWQWHRATTVTFLGNRLDGTFTSFRSSIHMSQLSGDSTASADATLASSASSVDKYQTYKAPRCQHPAFSLYSSQTAVLCKEVTWNRRSAEVA